MSSDSSDDAGRETGAAGFEEETVSGIGATSGESGAVGSSGCAEAVGLAPAETGGLSGGSGSMRVEDGPLRGGPAMPIEPRFNELSNGASLSAFGADAGCTLTIVGVPGAVITRTGESERTTRFPYGIHTKGQSSEA